MPAQWLQGYLQGSFRGVPFFISSASNSGGRRIATHAFPERDDVQHEDLGRRERAFSFSAYVVEDNYFQARNNLIAALEEKGPGKLVHPYRGEFQVVCDSFTMSERTAEGRMARFDLVFKEEVEENLTIVSSNTQSKTFGAKADFLVALKEWFEDAYTIVRKPVSYIEAATETIDQALDVIDALKQIANVNAEFKRALSNVRGKGIELTFSAQVLAQSFTSLVNFGSDVGTRQTLAATGENSLDQYREAIRLFEWGQTPAVNGDTEITQDPAYPAFLAQQLLQYSALASAIGLTSVIPYDSAEAATEAQGELFDLIDGIILNNNISDGMYDTLRAARAAISEDLGSRAVNLPRLVDFTVPNTSNALYVSQEIYGTISEAADIVARNSIVHPGFITPAGSIQVKIDV